MQKIIGVREGAGARAEGKAGERTYDCKYQSPFSTALLKSPDGCLLSAQPLLSSLQATPSSRRGLELELKLALCGA